MSWALAILASLAAVTPQEQASEELRRAVDRLNRKFAAVTRFTTTYTAESPAPKEGMPPDEFTATELQISLDRATRRIYFVVRGNGPKGEALESHVLIEGYLSRVWGSPTLPRMRLDSSALEAAYDKREREMEEGCSRLLPRAAPIEIESMVIGFQLSIGRENAGEDRPSFLHWFGMQSSRAGASWLQEALSGQLAEALPSRNAREFRLPGGKSIVVDDATGIMRAMNVVEPDGRRWNLTLRDLSTEGTFPAVTPPEDLPVAAFRDEAVGWLVANRIGGIKRVFEWVDANWDDLSKGGRLPAVQALVRKYLAFLVEQFEESYVRKAASWQARRWLQSGLTPEELRSDMESLSAGFAKGLGEQKEELRKGSSIFIEGSLENIRAGIRPSRETPREEVLSFMNEVFRPVDVLTLVTDVDPKRVRIILGEEVSRPTGR